MDGMGWNGIAAGLRCDRWVTMITNCISFPFVSLGAGVMDEGYAGTWLLGL